MAMTEPALRSEKDMGCSWLRPRLRALGGHLLGEVLHLRDGLALGAEATLGAFKTAGFFGGLMIYPWVFNITNMANMG